MKAILKSGKTVSITREEAKRILEMLISGEGNLLVVKNKFFSNKENLVKLIRINQIEAIV